MSAYYNEHDDKAAAWLRELIKAGHIADGEVDERSIEDVLPNELAGFTQCHFFAGIGVWSYALRRAGWTDDRPVWMGSCPCQPFSAAGKGDGFADERHLWPAFNHLIEQCRPDAVFGEQVASKDADTWIDLVHTDMEALGYAFGAIPFPSAGVGAPHIRDRLYWVADSICERRNARRNRNNRWHDRGVFDSNVATGGMAQSSSDRRAGSGESWSVEARFTTGRDVEGSPADQCGQLQAGLERSGAELFGGLGNTIIPGLEGQSRDGNGSNEPGRLGAQPRGPVAQASAIIRLDDPQSVGRGILNTENLGSPNAQIDAFANAGDMQSDESCGERFTRIVRPGPTNGFWRDVDWLGCRDGKWRPVEPGTFPLAHGASARVGRLRGFGNAINAAAAQAFIESYLGV